MARYSPEQLRTARIVANMTAGLPSRVRLALMMAGLVESNLRHLNYGDRSSMGFLQQRPDMGWGPYIPGVRGIRADVRDFLRRAIPANKQMGRGGAGELAQSVQRSAFPERYQERASEATSLLQRFRNAGAAAPAHRGGGSPAVQPVRITPQRLNMTSPNDVLAGLARVPSYVSQGGRNIPYQLGAGVAPPSAPRGMTVQGVTTGELYDQLRDIRTRLLTA